MNLSRVYPPSSSAIDTAADGAFDAVTLLYGRLSEQPSSGTARERPRVRINLVASIDGGATGGSETSDDLSSPVDRLVLRAIRLAADVVITGAATIRSEGIVVPKTGTLVIITRGREPHTLPRPDPLRGGGRVTVLCPPESLHDVATHFEHTGATVSALSTTADEAIDVEQILRLVSTDGVRDVVCEGGPTLAGAFVDAGVVDELCLTTSPIVSTRGRSVVAGSGDVPRRARLVQLLADDASFLYARWAFDTE